MDAKKRDKKKKKECVGETKEKTNSYLVPARQQQVHD